MPKLTLSSDTSVCGCVRPRTTVGKADFPQGFKSGFLPYDIRITYAHGGPELGFDAAGMIKLVLRGEAVAFAYGRGVFKFESARRAIERIHIPGDEGVL